MDGTKGRKIIFGKGMKIGQMAQKSQIGAANHVSHPSKKTRSGVKDEMGKIEKKLLK